MKTNVLINNVGHQNSLRITIWHNIWWTTCQIVENITFALYGIRILMPFFCCFNNWRMYRKDEYFHLTKLNSKNIGGNKTIIWMIVMQNSSNWPILRERLTSNKFVEYCYQQSTITRKILSTMYKREIICINNILPTFTNSWKINGIDKKKIHNLFDEVTVRI